MKEIENKVIGIVEDYKRDFPDEYKAVVQQIKDFRETLKDDWASTKDNKGNLYQGHAIKREIYRVPLTLDNLITNNLTVDEFEHTSSTEYAQWFAKQFPEFRVTKEI